MKLGTFFPGVGCDDASEPIGGKDGADFVDLLDFFSLSFFCSTFPFLVDGLGFFVFLPELSIR
jgi:hypothetical protein